MMLLTQLPISLSCFSAFSHYDTPTFLFHPQSYTTLCLEAITTSLFYYSYSLPFLGFFSLPFVLRITFTLHMQIWEYQH